MKTIKCYSLALVAAITLLTACQKESNPSTPTNTGTLQLLKIEQDANNYSNYAYNPDGLLTSFVTVHNQVITNSSTTYDASKRPVAVTMDDETYKLVYSGNKISQIDVYEQQNRTAYFTYTYTGNQITEADYYVNNTIAAKAISIYNGIGDMTSQKIYYNVGTSLQLANTTAYEYDAKPNPMTGNFNLSAMLLNSPAVHNVTKQTISEAGGNISQTNTYTLNYNGQGYPTQIACKTTKPGVPDVNTISKLTYK